MKSSFKENYDFLDEWFALNTGRPTNLKYAPHTRKFQEDFYVYLEVYFDVTTEGNYQFTICMPASGEKDQADFETEKEMLACFKKRLQTRKKIGQLKKAFLV